MNKKESYLTIPLDKLQSIRVMLSRLYRDNNNLHKDIELLLFYMYRDWNAVESIIKKWKKENKNMYNI